MTYFNLTDAIRKRRMYERDISIWHFYNAGLNVKQLAADYSLSIRSVRRIIHELGIEQRRAPVTKAKANL